MKTKKKWMTNEILNMIEERRLINGNTPKYNGIHRKTATKLSRNIWSPLS